MKVLSLQRSLELLLQFTVICVNEITPSADCEVPVVFNTQGQDLRKRYFPAICSGDNRAIKPWQAYSNHIKTHVSDMNG